MRFHLSNLPKRTLVLLIILFVVLIGAVVSYFFISRNAADTTADFAATHCQVGDGYEYLNSRNSNSLGDVGLKTNYIPLGKNISSNVTSYQGKEVELGGVALTSGIYKSRTYVRLYYDFSSFQSVNLTKTTLPELYQIELKLVNGQSTLRDFGYLVYDPNRPNDNLLEGNVGIENKDIVEYKLYRKSADKSVSEFVMSCSRVKTVPSPLKAKIVLPESETLYGLVSHYQLFSDSVPTSISTNDLTFRYNDMQAGSSEKSTTRHYKLGINKFFGYKEPATFLSTNISLKTPKFTFPDIKIRSDGNKYFARITYGNNQSQKLELANLTPNSGEDSLGAIFSVQPKDVLGVEISMQSPGSTEKVILKTNRTAFAGESDLKAKIGKNFDYSSFESIKNLITSLEKNSVAGEKYKKDTVSNMAFSNIYQPLGSGSSSLTSLLSGKSINYNFKILPNGSSTQISLEKGEPTPWIAGLENSLASPERIVAIVYDKQSNKIEKNLGKLFVGKTPDDYMSSAPYFMGLWQNFPIKFTDVSKIEVYRVLDSNLAVRELIFTTTPTAVISYPTPVVNTNLTCNWPNVSVISTEMTADEKAVMYGNQAAYVVKTTEGKTWRLLLSAWKVKDPANTISIKAMLGNLDGTQMSSKDVRLVFNIAPGNERAIIPAGDLALKQYEYYTGKKEVTVTNPTSVQLVVSSGDTSNHVFCLSNAVKIDDLLK